MRRIVALAAVSLASVELLSAQGRPVDWAAFGGDAQRSGWAKSDIRITHDNVKDFVLVLKRKLEAGKGPQSLTPPVVIGNLISYKGFKELAFVAGSQNRIWSIDADLDRIFWEKQLDTAAAPKSTCPAQASVMPALTPPATFGARSPRATTAAPRSTTAPVAFGAPRPVYAIAANGKLHRLNTSDGSDQLPPLDFLPAGSHASTLALSEGYIYTTTSTGCGGTSNGVFALDLSAAAPKTVSHPLPGAAVGEGGFAIGTDGTVYVQTAKELLALSAGDLKVKGTFSSSGDKTGATPVVFLQGDRDLIVSAGADGRLSLLDSQSINTPLSQTEPLGASGHGVWGGLSTWQDAENTRWVLAPIWGPAAGSIAAFKVQTKDGKPALVPAWNSTDMIAPQTPVITSGIVFALASGDKKKGAVLYALDAMTGKQMYSTDTQVTAPANHTGLAIANGRVFFTTTDNTLWGFGIFLER